jgi:hypothetical protein
MIRSNGTGERYRQPGEWDECANSLSCFSQDYDKRTALHLASSQGHLNIVEFLLGKGADVNCVDRMGFSPLVVPCHGTSAAARAMQRAAAQAKLLHERHILDAIAHSDRGGGDIACAVAMCDLHELTRAL